MDLVAYSQTYRTRSPERQLEIDACLRRNTPMVLFCESDDPAVPQGTVPVDVVASDERITYAEWFRSVRRQGSGIGLPLNADIYLDQKQSAGNLLLLVAGLIILGIDTKKKR